MEFNDDYSVVLYTLRKEFGKLLMLARSDDEESQKSLPDFDNAPPI